MNRIYQGKDTKVEIMGPLAFIVPLESRTLAALRDALLPKLLSGAVRVSEIITDKVQATE